MKQLTGDCERVEQHDTRKVGEKQTELLLDNDLNKRSELRRPPLESKETMKTC